MSFFKYRIVEAAGYGPWEYVHLNATLKDAQEHFREESQTLADQSELFRRIEFKRVVRPPLDWIEREIERVEANIRGYQQYLGILKAARPKLDRPKKEKP